MGRPGGATHHRQTKQRGDPADPDRVKAWRPCLGADCGEVIFTDRCHRLCKRCRDRRRSPECPARMPSKELLDSRPRPTKPRCPEED